MATVTEIWRYPVKSMAGERLDHCQIVEHGLEGDRRWAFIDGSPNRAGKKLTIRQHDGLMAYRARLSNGGVEVLSPTGEAHTLDGTFVRRLEEESSRSLTLTDMAGANFDDSHILIVNLATVRAFGEESGTHIDPRRFRANLYIDGLAPEEEISWIGRRIHAGDAELEVTSRCERCVVITRDPDTAQTSPELLRLLTEQHETCMGVYCRVIRPGRVAVSDLAG
jgi:uncharacterized protein YcbX